MHTSETRIERIEKALGGIGDKDGTLEELFPEVVEILKPWPSALAAAQETLKAFPIPRDNSNCDWAQEIWRALESWPDATAALISWLKAEAEKDKKPVVAATPVHGPDAPI